MILVVAVLGKQSDQYNLQWRRYDPLKGYSLNSSPILSLSAMLSA
jgi:hypothetical protein